MKKRKTRQDEPREIVDTRVGTVIPNPLPKKRGYLQVLTLVLLPGDSKRTYQWTYLPIARARK